MLKQFTTLLEKKMRKDREPVNLLYKFNYVTCNIIINHRGANMYIGGYICPDILGIAGLMFHKNRFI